MSRRLRDKDYGWKDVIGMPDQWDKKNLTVLINNFMKEKFAICLEHQAVNKCKPPECRSVKLMTGAQWAKAELEDSKKQNQSDDVFNPYGIKIKDSELRIGTAMPNVLWQRISDTAPTLFTDKDHYAWFIKNFPMFKVSQRF